MLVYECVWVVHGGKLNPIDLQKFNPDPQYKYYGSPMHDSEIQYQINMIFNQNTLISTLSGYEIVLHSLNLPIHKNYWAGPCDVLVSCPPHLAGVLVSILIIYCFVV